MDEYVAQKKLALYDDKELTSWVKKTKHPLFCKREGLDYPIENSRNIFQMVVDPGDGKFHLNKHQAELIRQSLKSYHVNCVVDGSRPMCKFSNKNKWYKLGETFYVSKEKLPVTFSEVLSNPTRVILTSGDVRITKKVNKK
jgi:hypothetical protein